MVDVSLSVNRTPLQVSAKENYIQHESLFRVVVFFSILFPSHLSKSHSHFTIHSGFEKRLHSLLALRKPMELKCQKILFALVHSIVLLVLCLLLHKMIRFCYWCVIVCVPVCIVYGINKRHQLFVKYDSLHGVRSSVGITESVCIASMHKLYHQEYTGLTTFYVICMPAHSYR